LGKVKHCQWEYKSLWPLWKAIRKLLKKQFKGETTIWSSNTITRHSSKIMYSRIW
jgi:hypothetical protein